LQKQLDEQREKVLETQKMRDEGARYVRELESAVKVYERTLENYDQVLLDSRSSYSSASILSPATPPDRHSRPRTTISLAVGLFAGFFFGLGGSVLYELLNRRVRSRDDVERDLGLQVLQEFKQARLR